jgi:hypothetical protein
MDLIISKAALIAAVSDTVLESNTKSLGSLL